MINSQIIHHGWHINTMYHVSFSSLLFGQFFATSPHTFLPNIIFTIQMINCLSLQITTVLIWNRYIYVHEVNCINMCIGYAWMRHVPILIMKNMLIEVLTSFLYYLLKDTHVYFIKENKFSNNLICSDCVFFCCLYQYSYTSTVKEM
jgi:hypothetical protein